MSTVLPADGITDLYSQEPFHRAILDTLPIAVGVFEMVSPTDFRVAFMNRIAREADYGHTTDVIGKRLDEIMPAATAVQVTHRFQDCLQCGTAQTIEDSYQLPNGLLWTTSTFVPMRDADGRISKRIYSPILREIATRFSAFRASFFRFASRTLGMTPSLPAAG